MEKVPGGYSEARLRVLLEGSCQGGHLSRVQPHQ